MAKKKEKTIYFGGLGRVPIKDATEPVSFRVEAEHIKKGKKNAPAACALALAARDNTDKFPYKKVIGAEFYKSCTHVAALIGGRAQVRRYLNPTSLRKKINGFDNSARKTFTPGEEITILPPHGQQRLGHHPSGPSGEHVTRPRYVPGKCQKRGMFKDENLAAYAAIQAKVEGYEIVQ